jgi:hypothetical protein
VNVSGTPYYVHDGHYYRPVVVEGEEHYAVVAPPAGVVVYDVPDADEIVINGTTYYVIDGVYYRRVYVEGRVAYVVVEDPR